jgi:hypothetical protein
MQGEAAHAQKHGRLQSLYELELDVGRADVAGPYQSHADTKQLRATRPDLARRMNANRKGHVTELTRSDAHHGKDRPHDSSAYRTS